jgi:hypothetical protein
MGWLRRSRKPSQFNTGHQAHPTGCFKQLSGFIAKEPAQLSEKAIKQISYQLEQRCRDVEF